MSKNLRERAARLQRELEQRARLNQTEGGSWGALCPAGQQRSVLHAKAIGREGVTIYVLRDNTVDVEAAGNAPSVFRDLATIRYKIGAVAAEFITDIPYRGLKKHFVADEIDVSVAVNGSSEYSFYYAGGFREGNVPDPVQQITWDPNDYSATWATFHERLLAPFSKEFRVYSFGEPGQVDSPEGLVLLYDAQLAAGGGAIWGGPICELADWTPLPRDAVSIVALANDAAQRIVAEVR